MQMIMENFRNYQSALKEQFGDHDNKIYLVEGKNKTPSHIQMDELIQRLDEGKYTESQVLKIWERSFDYEAQEVNRLLEEHMLQEQDEEAEAPGADVKVPKWLEALGKMFNKGLGMISAVIDKGVEMVVGVATKIFNFIARFKDKHPVMFNIIIGVIVGALCLAVLYVMAEFLSNLLENSNVEEVGLGVPLCGPGLSEEIGQCITVQGAGGGDGAPKTLTEDQYKKAMGLLDSMKGKYHAESSPDPGEFPVRDFKLEEQISALDSAQSGLTNCYEGAQRGEVVMLDKIAGGAAHSGKAIRLSLKTVNYAEEAADEILPWTPAPDVSSGSDNAENALARWAEKGEGVLKRIQEDAKALQEYVDVASDVGPDHAGGQSWGDWQWMVRAKNLTDDQMIRGSNKLVSDALNGSRGERKVAVAALTKMIDRLQAQADMPGSAGHISTKMGPGVLTYNPELIGHLTKLLSKLK